MAACSAACGRCRVEEEGEVYIAPHSRAYARHRALSDEPASRGGIEVLPLKAVKRDIKTLFRATARALMVAPRFNLNPRRRRSYKLDRRVDEGAIFQMDQDLPRTAGSDPVVRAKRGRIRSMLLRHMAEDPQLGYCQGMNFVAAVFAVAVGDRDKAYARFHGFMQRNRGLWLPGFPLLEMGVAHLVTVAKERQWFQHLNAHDVRPSMFLPQALLTLFTMWLPLTTVVECLAMLERDGLLAMVAMTVAVLDHATERLLKQQSMEELLRVFRELPALSPEPQELVTAATKELPECRSRSGSAEELARLLKDLDDVIADPDAMLKAAEAEAAPTGADLEVAREDSPFPMPTMPRQGAVRV